MLFVRNVGIIYDVDVMRSVILLLELCRDPVADTVHAVFGGLIGQYIFPGYGFDHRIRKLSAVRGESLVEVIPAA